MNVILETWILQREPFNKHLIERDSGKEENQYRAKFDSYQP
jgi:hypothetical protein